MKSTKLVLMRHGRSLLNDGHVSSEFNNVLTQRGVLMTLAEAEPLRHENIQVVLTSPIRRAFQTATLAVSAIGRGLPIVEHDELQEMMVHEDHLHTESGYGDDAAQDAFKKDIDLIPAWAIESQRMVYERVRHFLEEILPTSLSLGSVLVVSHYFAIRGMRAWLEHGDPERMQGYKPRNSAPVIYDADDVLRRISGIGITKDLRSIED